MSGSKQEPAPEVTAAADRSGWRKKRGSELSTELVEPQGSGRAPNKDMWDGEHVVADERNAADDERAGEIAQPAESERVAHPSQEAKDVKTWDLYIVEHPPDDEGSALRSEDDELDSSWGWDLYDAESDRGSITVGVNGGNH